MRSPWCSGLAVARARASSPTPLREGVWPHGGGAQERPCPSCSARADHAGWTSGKILKEKKHDNSKLVLLAHLYRVSPARSAYAHAQLCRNARHRYIYIHINARAVSHLGVLLRLLGTHCSIVLITIPYSRRSPLGRTRTQSHYSALR